MPDTVLGVQNLAVSKCSKRLPCRVYALVQGVRGRQTRRDTVHQMVSKCFGEQSILNIVILNNVARESPNKEDRVGQGYG